MHQSLAFIPGSVPPTGPLNRFLPPIPDGCAAAWLVDNLPSGAWVLDPFGNSPRLAVEIARAGYRVLAAVNNPIARFLIELRACSPTIEELRLALAELSASQKGDERLEPHLRGLYRSECASCGADVEVQAFIWERGADGPTARIYTCPQCKDSGEHLANEADGRRARSFVSGGLHRARALERVAPLDDPDRPLVQEALEMYLPRAVYALITLVNKLESLTLTHRRLAEALLLAAFDQANVMWPAPSGRQRPRQLNIPARFLEKNIWLAMEEALTAWLSTRDAGQAPLTIWPELPPESGGICIYEGRLKDLAGHLAAESRESIHLEAVLTSIPRPNQAYWTLSALWSGWLWGREASAPFKSVLRRRRYDWSWHTEALYSVLNHMPHMLQEGAPFFGLVSESEPGLLSALLLAAHRAGFELQDLGIRSAEDLIQVLWCCRAPIAGQGISAPIAPEKSTDAAKEEAAQLAILARPAAQEVLRSRGEPTPYIHLHGAVLKALLAALEPPLLVSQSPSDTLQTIDATIEKALTAWGAFTRFEAGGKSLETGLWWLGSEPAKAVAGPTLADRVEIAIVRLLLGKPGLSAAAIDAAVCREFPGLLTPERELILACLDSYGQKQPVDFGLSPAGWELRAEDAPSVRRGELEEMRILLEHTGQRLGYTVEPVPFGERPLIAWRNVRSREYLFYLTASTVLSELIATGLGSAGRKIVVLPGGRARLVEHKLQQDPRLRSAIEGDWEFLKFRHLRRIAEDEALTQESLERLLPLDPLGNKDAQLSLL